MEKTKDKEVYMKEYKEFTVRYLLDEDEQDAVKSLIRSSGNISVLRGPDPLRSRQMSSCLITS